MYKDIDPLNGFEAASQKVDPLLGFKEYIPSGNTPTNIGLGYFVSVSQNAVRLSSAARKFLGTDYVQLFFNYKTKQMAIKASTKTTQGRVRLIRSSKRKMGQSLNTSKSLLNDFSKFDNLNLSRFRYRFPGTSNELGNPVSATLLKADK